MGREPWSEPRTRQIVEEHSGLEGPLMPILHACVETFGCVPQEAVPVIAKELNLKFIRETLYTNDFSALTQPKINKKAV